MGTKANPGNFDCYAKALPDEPMFVLLARDRSTPALVRSWADWREGAIKRGDRPESDRAMIREARDCADAMELWREENDGRWRGPMESEMAIESLEDGGPRWWAVKINDEIQDVHWGTPKEVRSNCDLSGMVEFGEHKLPMTIDIVPVTVTEEDAD